MAVMKLQFESSDCEDFYRPGTPRPKACDFPNIWDYTEEHNCGGRGCIIAKAIT